MMKAPVSCPSKPHLTSALVPALVALALIAHQGLQGSYPSRLTASDTAVEVSSPVEALIPSFLALPRSAPKPLAPPVEEPPVPADTLPLAHGHLSRVNHGVRARTLHELGDLSGALTEYRRALYDNPEDEETLNAIARLGRLTGKTELAVLALDQIGRLNPDEASPLVQQARLLISVGRSTEAIRVGEVAISRDPEEPDAYLVLGRAYMAAGNLSEAILRFQQAVHLAPEHGYALNNLGLAWLRANENAKAAEVLARAAALLPQVAYVHNNLGVAYERLGRTDEAQAAYATATRLSPRYVKARVNVDRMNKVASLGVIPSESSQGDGPGGLLTEDSGQ
ncbi:tetratricopeptide repeat protein [Hyalangium versicolor]|uniref:tetratricopeptide repeat protein n=1 Tax=Hyalangium versicolor TaxID=2861190 RepID=UPI001CCFE31C|nr:tetratricopeptide repeat protein [Hyalangium versicolor]